MHEAIIIGNDEICKILIEANCNFEKKNKANQSVMDILKEKGKEELINLI